MTEEDTGTSHGYAQKWKGKMIEAYKIASANSKQSSSIGKANCDKRCKGVTLQVGDRVLVNNLSERGGFGKLRPYWGQTVYIVREQIGANPLYKVSPETGGRPIRTLRRNLLLQVNDLPVDIVQSPGPEASDSEEDELFYWFRIPRSLQERQRPDEPVHSESQSTSGSSQLRQMQTVPTQPQQERDSVTGEEHVILKENGQDAGQRAHSWTCS